MKYLVVLSFIIFSLSCAEKKSGASSKIEKVSQEGKEYTSKYICPMHCTGSGSDTSGICPVCGMDYELNESYAPKPVSQ